jgi:hypothetical protein
MRSNKRPTRLISALFSLHEDINNVWRPLAEAKILPLVQSAEQAIANLGTDPAEMTAAALLTAVAAQMKDKWVAIPALFSATMTKARNSKEAAIEAGDIETRFVAWLNKGLNLETPQSLFGAAELKVAVASAFTDTPSLKAARFGQAKELVVSAVMASLVAHVRTEREGIRARALDSLRRTLCTHGDVTEVARNVVTEVLYFCVLPSLAAPGRLALDAAWLAKQAAQILTESAEHVAARRAACAKLAQYRASLKTVQTIDEHMNRTATDAVAAAL